MINDIIYIILKIGFYEDHPFQETLLKMLKNYTGDFMKYTKIGNNLTEAIGESLAEAFVEKGKGEVLKESFGITFKEAGQTTANNTGAYTNLLSKTLYQAALERSQKILDLVDINEDLLRAAGGGFGAYQIPRLTPTIAYEVAEGQKVNTFDEGIDPVVVTPRKVVAGTSITWELKKRGMNDFVKFVMRNAAQAIERKLCSDIVNGLVAGSNHAGIGGGLSYDNVVDAETNVNNAEHTNGVKFGFIADALVISAGQWGAFKKDEDVKSAMYYASASSAQSVNAAQNPLMFGNLEIVVTPFLTSAHAIVLEKKRNILVKESNLETFEGRIPGSADDEVIALMSYILAMVFPDSVAYIEA